ncbi:CRE-SSUP-72 protein [Caenorhabditis remanei]|uniref:RNA polymerase II subunit A C-terminal domain phosphatase SSU72 n=2 Tax=Caenorhabditis remanei TaxID=31234 RepID=E3LQU8_CAERE|nr:CRE-SSUP-72 protein [Caenorhabditis remanei]
MEYPSKLRFAVSCSSNMNRSMEAHLILKKRGFNIESYGSGTQVKMPGPTIDKPNCYEFGPTTYDDIFADLTNKDKDLYRQNGLLFMVDRNRRIKTRPQRFQAETREFDVILCLEERVFDQVIDFLNRRVGTSGNPVHVINIDIEDNAEEATFGAFFLAELCTKLEKSHDFEEEIDQIITDLEEAQPKRNLLHTICFY